MALKNFIIPKLNIPPPPPPPEDNEELERRAKAMSVLGQPRMSPFEIWEGLGRGVSGILHALPSGRWLTPYEEMPEASVGLPFTSPFTGEKARLGTKGLAEFLPDVVALAGVPGGVGVRGIKELAPRAGESVAAKIGLRTGQAVLAPIAATEILPGLAIKGISKAAQSAFKRTLSSGIDKWIATQGRNPEGQSALGKFVVGKRTKVIEYATNNLKRRMSESRAAKRGYQQAAKMATEDTIKDIEKNILPEFTRTRTDITVRDIQAGKFREPAPSVGAVQGVRGELGKVPPEIQQAAQKGVTPQVTPIEAPRAEAMFGEADAGLQKSMLGEVPEREVRVMGKGKITQTSLDDLQKLMEVKGRLPEGMGTRAEVKLEIARREAQKLIVELTDDTGGDTALLNRNISDSIKEVQAELSNRSLPYHGGASKNLFPEYDSKQLDEYLNVLEAAREAPTTTPTTPAAPPGVISKGIPPTEPPIPPETGITPEPPSVEPSGRISFANLQDAQTVIDYSTKPNVSRWIANLPLVREVMSKVNPSAIAGTPGEKAVIARAVLREEGTQKAQGVISYLNELGGQEKVFGKLDDNGLISSGKLKGLSVNDIRTYPKRYADKLTPEQKTWIGRAHEIEVAKLKFMRDNGIDIKELSFEEGGEYAGRRVFAKMSSDGELLDSGYVGAGPTRVGKKTAFEKRRRFTTAEEALSEGYRYLPDDEALSLNVRAAYNRVADKKMSEWLLTQVPWRTTGASEELVLAAESAKMRLNRSLQLSAAINRAVRGERVPDATLNSIARVYPEEALELKLAIPEIQAGRPTAESIQQLTKKAKALIKSDRADWNAAVNARARAREKAMAPGFGEAMIMHPAFSGKIFTGPEAKKLADTMRQTLDPGMSQALTSVNKVNALVRFFKLAGDFSPLGIQLIFLAGQNPRIYGGAAASIPRLLLDTEFQAKFLSENKAVIDRHPGLLLSSMGTEFTEAMAKGGMLSTRMNVWPKQDAMLKKLGLLPPRVAGKAEAMVLSPFQRVFEGTLDYAGIKMAEALEHLGKTPAEMAEVDQFINEFRGLTSSAKLGVSPNWRAGETATLLAPRYNRAIAALLFDATKGAVTFGQSGIRNRLAIQGLTKGIAAISAVAVAISLALGQDWEEIAEHFDPNSPRFFTWNVNGTNIGPGTKVRSVVKLIAQTLDNPEALFQFSMENPALRFVRGNLAPVLGGSVDLLTSRNYIGDPVRSDVATFTKEMLVKNFLPIWVENVVYEGGELSQKLLRGAGEFFGGRAYPETESDQVNRLRERYAAKEYGRKYEELNNSEKDSLRDKYDDLAKIEEEAKVYWAERGSGIERFYFNEKQRITDERNAGLDKAAQAYLDGSIAKYDYDKQRGYIRPYYSGGREVLWSVKERLDEYSVEQMEKWLDENIKPEDKALGEYQEYRGKMIEGADLPIDRDIVKRELESYLTKYPPDIQAYVIANMNNWINGLPTAAKKVEQERAKGIEDETWWDDYMEVGTTGKLQTPKLNIGGNKLKIPGLKIPALK